MNNKLPIIFATALALTSCIYDFDAGEVFTDERVVIEGDISLGDVCEFSARSVYPLNKKGSVKDLFPNVLFIVEDDQGGQYKAIQKEYAPAKIDLTSAPTDRKYRLYVEIRSGDYAKYASPWMEPLPAPVIGDLTETVNKTTTNTELVLGLDLSLENGSGCYRWDYEELYRFHSPLPGPEFEYKVVSGNPTLINHALVNDYSWWPYTYCWRQTNSLRTSVAIARALEGWKLEKHKILTIPLQSDELGTGEFYLKVKAKSISETQYKYLDAMNKGSDNVGSLLSPLPSDITGNIRNVDDATLYAIGYVAVNTVATKVFRVETKGIDKWHSPLRYYRSPYDMFPDLHTTAELYRAAYSYGFYPYKWEETTVQWVPINCIDCRKNNGTLEKPAGWEMEGEDEEEEEGL